MNIVQIDYTSKAATDYIINPAAAGPLHPSINKMTTITLSKQRDNLSPPSIKKQHQIPPLSKIEQIQIVDISSGQAQRIRIDRNQSIHQQKIYNMNKIIELEQRNSSPIEIDSNQSYSTPISQYFPSDQEDISSQDKTLNFKKHSLRIKDLMIIGKDQYQNKGIYSEIYKIKTQYMATKLQMKEQQRVHSTKNRSKKQEHFQDIQRSKLKLLADGKVKSLGFRSTKIYKQKKSRKKGQNRKKCKKLE